MSGRNSVVECQLPKLNARSSNLLARSMKVTDVKCKEILDKALSEIQILSEDHPETKMKDISKINVTVSYKDTNTTITSNSVICQ